MPSISLNFINNSSDLNNSSIVIFQSDPTLNTSAETVQPHHVLHDLAPGERRQVTINLDSNYTVQVFNSSEVSIMSKQTPVTAGQALKAVEEGLEIMLEQHGNASNSFEIQVLNGLEQSNMNVTLFSNNVAIHGEDGIAPNASATFPVASSLYIGRVSGEPAEITLNSVLTTDSHTQIPVSGVSSADIVLTGGGLGINSTPYKFTLTDTSNIPSSSDADGGMQHEVSGG